MKTRIRGGLVLIILTYIATIWSILLGCTRMHKNRQIDPDRASESSRRDDVDYGTNRPSRSLPTGYFEYQHLRDSDAQHHHRHVSFFHPLAGKFPVVVVCQAAPTNSS